MARSLPHHGLVLLLGGATMNAACQKKEHTEQTRPVASLAPPARSTPGAAPSASAPEAPPRAATPASVETFDATHPGGLPKGWRSAVGQWRVEAPTKPSRTGHVFAQMAANESPVYNVALLETALHADVDITVRLRAREGRIDQGGGVVWRAADEQNYYVARYNPLEDNFRVYRVVSGRRTQLGSSNVRVSHDDWHTMRVTMTGDHVECSLDGKKHLDVHDPTFAEAGFVGLWTKADARTEFDDFEVHTPASGSSGRPASTW